MRNEEVEDDAAPTFSFLIIHLLFFILRLHRSPDRSLIAEYF